VAFADSALSLPDRLFVVQESYDTSIDIRRHNFSKKPLNEKYDFEGWIDMMFEVLTTSLQIDPTPNMGTPNPECLELFGEAWN
jgi:hypothetical protein